MSADERSSALSRLHVRRLLVVVLVAHVADLGRRGVDLLEVLAVEERRGLLERAVLRLDDEQVHEHRLEREPAAVHDLVCARRQRAVRMGGESIGTHVVLPADVAERDGVDVLVEDERDGDDKVEDVETFGTNAIRQDFDGVGNDQGRECKAVMYCQLTQCETAHG